MKAYITDASWSFNDIVAFFDKQCDIMVPDWKKESSWRNCVPQGNTYLDFTHWWLTWQRLGNECDLREQDWKHQFNACMNHRGFFSRYLKEIIEFEIIENTSWTLERRRQFVENKLMIAFKAQETLQVVGASESSNLVSCYSCGRR
jgi:hypothetical protein